MQDLIIIGGGPRGISLALQAVHRDIPVTLIDPDPFSSWKEPNIIPNIEMRSPLSFDLVTYLEDLYPFSLARFLDYPDRLLRTQKEIETDDIKVTRYQFCAYLSYIWEHILSKINYIQQEVKEIKDGSITLLDNTELIGKAVVIATGNKYSKVNIPHWVTYAFPQENIVTLKDILSIQPRDKRITVLGSGQGAAELVYLLASLDNKVNWLLKSIPKINQYPAPSYSSWYSKSALGSYYSNLISPLDRMNYLEKIKAWQPSITPYIKSKLDSIFYNQVCSKDYKDLSIANSSDYLVLMTGRVLDINLIPIEEIKPNKYLPQYPSVDREFKLEGFNNVYITGLLALAYDGPRQNSLISAGITSRRIINDIYN
ncbi:SidA/IucD/PvdA family monooxygenase [Calothrix sp. FACHB-1219]|uniref:SidA/IucD/PvdA family monooxygenase n=1 Tax=unclassified Calothrix TaxID=2619626 RepID=UPI0016823BA3|nr:MULTISPECIES: SidA/IucD/PvdA family monooxygenase [unclassified Calothrix]MBD2201533.1 SidA/IucD/PvdA family monooxygenase [Calothrix sp. FACHB-168]MBD2217219.1 SidA/IucD/PvdA family monooxygenase [Calothrix sp. FACHB-1219]